MRPDPAGSLAPGARAGPGAACGAVAGRTPVAGIYLASRHRGHGLFGPRVDEIAILREELGPMPLIGLVTDAEIFDGMVHEAAGVLVLIGVGGSDEQGVSRTGPSWASARWSGAASGCS